MKLSDFVPKWSVPAAMRAIRAMVCVCGLFAFTDKVLGNPQIATFAAFGSFATLVLASFAGTWRDKLLAHLALALTGSVLITIATIVSSTTWLVAIVTVPATFAVFFAGVTGPNAASGVTGALLAWVLPAASVGTVSMVPDRLIGWWMASVCGTALVLLFSPRSSGGNQLNAAASALAGKLADVLDAALRGRPSKDDIAAMVDAKHGLIAAFTSTPYRPTGLDTTDQALANCVELLEWTEDLISDAVEEQHDLREAPPPDLELIAVSSAALRDAASLLAGGDARPDIDELERCRAAVLTQIQNSTPPPPEFRQAAQISFHANAVAVAVLGVAYETMIASRLVDPEWLEARRARWYTGGNAAARTVQRVSSVATAAHTHASLRSVWFVNSLRGAVALAVAVAVADVTTVQHGFWVVLGTLSVLRTNASATGATALRAIAGTAIGFVIGGALVLAIGSDETALWIVFPFAVLVAAYSPGTAPFAVGQAAFTVLIAILFNLIVPVGWKVGVVRIEDVALGCAVSAVVGTLFWPRGVSSVVGDDLADAFRTGASYLIQAVQWATGARAADPDTAMPAGNAGIRLEEGLRGFLAEQGSKRIAKQDLWRLVGGSLRLRLTAHAVAEMPGDATGLDEARAVLERRTATLASWYDELAEQVGKPDHRAVSELAPPSLAADGIVDESSGSYYGVWLCEHLDHLSQHAVDLVAPGVAVANLRRRPWWR
ncbi:MAG TPA: FUSC family protein [Solirubrobacteraceae bacterium]|nr:FUSC family protein [Solirubrobacteraceae bacterium]